MRFGFAPKLKLASPALYHPLPLRSLNFWQQGCDSCNSLAFGFGGSCVVVKLVNGSRVGQVGPVDSCGQVGDRDPSLVNSRNLSRVGQVRPVNSCGQVRNIRVKMTSLVVVVVVS